MEYVEGHVVRDVERQELLANRLVLEQASRWPTRSPQYTGDLVAVGLNDLGRMGLPRQPRRW